MENMRFAVCIVLPGTTTGDIVHAALHHCVHLLNQEPYDPEKDYTSYPEIILSSNDQNILPLFVFQKDSVLAEDEQSLKLALEKLNKYRSKAQSN
jgi:hypothetical protein